MDTNMNMEMSTIPIPLDDPINSIQFNTDHGIPVLLTPTNIQNAIDIYGFPGLSAITSNNSDMNNLYYASDLPIIPNADVSDPFDWTMAASYACQDPSVFDLSPLAAFHLENIHAANLTDLNTQPCHFSDLVCSSHPLDHVLESTPDLRSSRSNPLALPPLSSGPASPGKSTLCLVPMEWGHYQQPDHQLYSANLPVISVTNDDGLHLPLSSASDKSNILRQRTTTTGLRISEPFSQMLTPPSFASASRVKKTRKLQPRTSLVSASINDDTLYSDADNYFSDFFSSQSAHSCNTSPMPSQSEDSLAGPAMYPHQGLECHDLTTIGDDKNQFTQFDSSFRRYKHTDARYAMQRMRRRSERKVVCSSHEHPSLAPSAFNWRRSVPE